MMSKMRWRDLKIYQKGIFSSNAPLNVRCASSDVEYSQGQQIEVQSSTLGAHNFAFAKHGDFIQVEPEHQNSYTSDSFLQSYLRHNIPSEVMNSIDTDLTQFGGKCAHEIWNLGQQCEQNPPYLRQTDAWGKRIDEIVTCEAWKEQKRIAAREGLISIPYQNEQDVHSRLYQCAKLYMYSPASGLYNCPLAMTDGAAKTIQALQLDLPQAWNHLTSRDPSKFWTSGQWMTERKGGSDVGAGTETIAIPQQDGSYKLYGYKWFSSATDSDMTMTLARIQNPQTGEIMAGSKGISMFYLKIRNDNGALNNIQVVKLKNKLGTRQLPTAELLLGGTDAKLVSPEGRGIPAISSMLTISRLHNSISSAAAMRKIVSLARDYAVKRTAFGRSVADQPLHMQTLARMEVDTRGSSVLVFDLARQLGLHDNGCIQDQDMLLMRLMTPVAKLFTAKMAVATVSEGLECFGGQGYIEDTGIPGLLRDSQVLPIWEGTTNILSLDVVRAITKTKGEVLKAFMAKISQVENQVKDSAELKDLAKEVTQTVQKSFAIIQKQPEILEHCARDLSFTLANTYIAALLIEHANRTRDPLDAEVVSSWMKRDVAPLLRYTQTYSGAALNKHQNLVYQNYEHQK
eukprot:TRINITY_DN34511_c0_g1_i2.p1 TRINITY_DN34511_c0_g1~~TRINITY_DN34511_c0_g1_i2.p1  ORF type:complete len:627 (-),score=103.98 TRINITY_DN34511_c0_g1_i2:156-2036(-)